MFQLFFLKIGVSDITCRNEKKLFSQKTGEQIGKQRRVAAEFKRGIPGWALPLATQTFPLAAQNKPDTMPIELYFCWYDSERDQRERGWSPEEREIIEERLRAKAGIVLVESPKVTAPYAKYDQHRRLKGQRKAEHAIKDIVGVYESAGFEIPVAVAYERQEYGSTPEHAEVLAALEALGAGDSEPEELIAA